MPNILGYLEWGCKISWGAKYPVTQGPDQLNQCFKHAWLFAVSIERVNMAPELVVFLFLWVLRLRWTELARRVVLRRREARKRRFRFLQHIFLTQELLLVPRIERLSL